MPKQYEEIRESTCKPRKGQRQETAKMRFLPAPDQPPVSLNLAAFSRFTHMFPASQGKRGQASALVIRFARVTPIRRLRLDAPSTFNNDLA